MASETKYFVFNRAEDWQRGVFYDMDYAEALTPTGGTRYAAYISPSLDSLNVGGTWHRLRLDYRLDAGSVIYFRFYANDSPRMDINGQPMLLRDYFADESIPFVEKEQLFTTLAPRRLENPFDVPLFSLQGRYLWFMVEIYGSGAEPPALNSLKIEFPRIPFTSYLPEIYRRNQPVDSFLARFVAMFQSIYLDLEEKIDNMPANFDLQTADKDFLEWMCEWLSVDEGFLWGEDKMRRLLAEIVPLYRAKGGRWALSRVVELFTGSEPVVVEQFEAARKDNGYEKQHVTRLYGEKPRDFCVLVEEKYVPTAREYAALSKIISSFSPAGSQGRLVVMQNVFLLDGYVYLGVNTVLRKPEALVLDGKLAMPLGILSSTFEE